MASCAGAITSVIKHEEVMRLLPETVNAFKRHINTMPGLTDAERAERLRKGLDAFDRIRRIFRP